MRLENQCANPDRSPLNPIPVSAGGNWKLIEFYWKKDFELYDLTNDPAEQQNLAAGKPEKVAELQAKLDAFRKDTGAFMPVANPDAKQPFEKW